MKGETITSRRGIADVFGEFYAKLYDECEETVTKENEAMDTEETRAKVRSSLEEVRTDSRIRVRRNTRCHRSSQRGKAGDSSGIKAEHMKRCNSETKEWIRRISNEIVQEEECTPQTRRRIRIKVIHKKGDVENAGNCRPICSPPVLYNLFATAFFARLAPPLDKMPASRSGWFQAKPPNDGSPDGIQNDGAALSRVYISTIDFMKRSTLVDIIGTLRNWNTIH